jgi:hypothetical protein
MKWSESIEMTTNYRDLIRCNPVSLNLACVHRSHCMKKGVSPLSLSGGDIFLSIFVVFTESQSLRPNGADCRQVARSVMQT